MNPEEFEIIKEIKTEEAEHIYGLFEQQELCVTESKTHLILPSLDDNSNNIQTMHISNSTDAMITF